MSWISFIKGGSKRTGSLLPVKLIAGLIYKDDGQLLKVRNLLEREFGVIDSESEQCEFSYTTYYEAEFGRDLKRKYCSFEKLVCLEKIYNAKVRCNALEQGLSRSGKRTVNIDPGYICHGNLVLFTTKNYTHRVYIGKSIYAESTLKFQDGSFAAWPWTYPDYKQEKQIKYFNGVRAVYCAQVDRMSRRG